MAGKKRKSPQDSPDGIYSNKSRNRPSAEAKVDPTYGQRSAIPGLDEGHGFEEDDLLYDEDMDALAYLRSVRQEACGIPNLLVAPKTPTADNDYDLYEDGVGDFRGRYEDGAYLAAADTTPEADPESLLDERSSYFDSIISRYHELHSRLAQVPPNEIVLSLGPNHPTQVGPLTKRLSRWWIYRMRVSDPKPAQIACMSRSSVLRLLNLLTQGTLLKRGSEVDFGLSYWVWSLLARLPERGELNSEEIGVVRDLGKKAVLIGMGLKEVEGWQQGIEDVEAQFEENLGGDESTVINDEEINIDAEDEAYEEDYIEDVVNHNETTTSSRPRTDSESLLAGFDISDDDEDTEQPVSASSQTLLAATEPARTAENIEDLSTENNRLSPPEDDESEDLAAMKAQALHRLNLPEPQVNIEPQVSKDPRPRPPPSKSNTRATVDMIITVAGEIYGQRDLLEFRSEWAHIM